MDVDEEDELCGLQSTLKQGLFDTTVKIRKLIKCDDTKDSLINNGVRLPKIDLPTYNGDILSWRTF